MKIVCLFLGGLCVSFLGLWLFFGVVCWFAPGRQEEPEEVCGVAAEVQGGSALRKKGFHFLVF